MVLRSPARLLVRHDETRNARAALPSDSNRLCGASAEAARRRLAVAASRAWPIHAHDRSTAGVQHCRCDRIVGARQHAPHGCLLAARTAARAGSRLTHDAATADSPHRINVHVRRWHERLLFPRLRRGKRRRLRALLLAARRTAAGLRRVLYVLTGCSASELADGSRPARGRPAKDRRKRAAAARAASGGARSSLKGLSSVSVPLGAHVATMNGVWRAATRSACAGPSIGHRRSLLLSAPFRSRYSALTASACCSCAHQTRSKARPVAPRMAGSDTAQCGDRAARCTCCRRSCTSLRSCVWICTRCPW